MNHREKKPRVMDMALSLKLLAARLSLVMLVLFAISIFIFNLTNPQLIQRFKVAVTDVVTPVIAAISSPIHTYRSIVADINHAVFLYDENDRLRTENLRLRQSVALSAELMHQNTQLQSLVNFLPDSEFVYRTGRIIASTGGLFEHSALMNIGQSSGIDVGYMVANNDGLVGRVQEAGNGSARIMLITDSQSRVPVITESSRERAILMGNGERGTRLIHLPQDTQVRIGERIVTTGDGGLFSKAVPVGVVENVTPTAITVRPYVDWSRLEYVVVAKPKQY